MVQELISEVLSLDDSDLELLYNKVFESPITYYKLENEQ